VANVIAHWEAQKPEKSRAVDEWKRLWDLLDHWERSVTGKGFMDPVLYNEDGQVFTTIWFTRGVCGRCSGRLSDGTQLASNRDSSVIMANVSPYADFAAGHRSFSRLELHSCVPEYRGLSPIGLHLHSYLY
jgi:hypothetical protein